MTSIPTLSRPTVVAALAAALTLTPPASAQTIRGRLLDGATGRPIDLGVVVMRTEAGDSVTQALTNPAGYFSLTSPEPGSFVLIGSAWGYRETPAGVFELGEGGTMTVDFRIRPEPIPMDEILVGLDRPVYQHKLIRQGFVDRMQRGLGVFITPADIERSMARETEMLLAHIPGVMVGPESGPSGYMGDVVKMWTPVMGRCDPIVYVDGIQMRYDQPLLSISTMVPLATVEAIEVYRRPAEIPVEFGVTQSQNRLTLDGEGTCGVIVFWTKSGPAPGAVPLTRTRTAAGGTSAAPLPEVDAAGPPPEPGENIRVQLAPQVRESFGLGSPWEGTFREIRGAELIAADVFSARPIAVPLAGVEALQVERPRGPGHALKRGAIAGAIFALGSWASLRLICGPACGRRDEARLPALGIGAFAGLLVAGQGPGSHWVRAPLPTPEGGAGWLGARLPGGGR